MHYHWESLAAGVHRCRLPFLDVTVGFIDRLGLFSLGSAPRALL